MVPSSLPWGAPQIPWHSPGMLFSKRPQCPGHPILRHKALCSPALYQDVTGNEFYSLSFQLGGCLAGPRWVLQNSRCTKAEEQKYQCGDVWQSCLLHPQRVGCKMDTQGLAERTPAACIVLTRAHLHARLMQESHRQRHCSADSPEGVN